MIAYKGFKKGKTGPEAILGSGTMTYEVGKWYETKGAQTASMGFHCCENPLECLTFYSWNNNNVFYAVEVAGDVDEDGASRICCTKIRLLKQLDLQSFILASAQYLLKHPKVACHRVHEDRSSTTGRESFVFVRGKNPCGAGKKGDCVVLLQEAADSKEIQALQLIHIDGKKYVPMVYYDIDRRAVE
jgi:hypothetical protein